MIEQEYIDATNLAKLRTAMTIVRDCLPMRDDEKEFEEGIRQALARWINKLENIVSGSALADPQPAAGDQPRQA